MSSQKYILIVDDNEIDRLVLRRHLERSGVEMQIQELEDAETAMEQVSTWKEAAKQPEFLFLDLNMPALDGWDVLDSIEKTLGKVGFPIYVITSSLASDDISRARQLACVSGVINKPLTQEVLREKVQGLV